MSKLPESVPFEDKEVACWTYAQLERLSKANLKQRNIKTARSSRARKKITVDACPSTANACMIAPAQSCSRD